MTQRTSSQNRSLHLWYRLKADQCRAAGVTPRMAFSKTMELEMSEHMMKAIWKTVQKPLLNKPSTTQLDKTGEIEQVLDHLNRFFAEEFNLEAIPFPHDPDKEKSDLLEGMKLDVRKDENYPDYEEPLI